jgi:FAD/FMN-containing dehydrogenase/Fe-S oxidoreductase
MDNESLLAEPDLSATGRSEIPFNYTSADDRQAVGFLLGDEWVQVLEELRAQRVTGRSARLMMRFFGEILVHRRNPYLFQELLDSPGRRRRLLGKAGGDLATIEANAGGEPRVLAVLGACRALLAGFREDLERAPGLRRRLLRELGAVVGGENVQFDPFALVAHATDATDWRLHLPAAVATPEREEQVGPLLEAIARLGLRAIPRGAGTGLTGGAVPLQPGCVMVNTERLNRIRGLAEATFEGPAGEPRQAMVLELEAGVVTEQAMAYAAERGLVFATDPTSAWAATIGGNIAENAGGKLAVRWGTCIDNLLSWRLALPGGRTWEVRRTDHRLRKLLPGDTACFQVADGEGRVLKEIRLRAEQIRKPGLWKDITRKALGGLPGLQKEGTDGVITSARFVLHPAYAASRTLCLEFFGPDMDEASQVILEIARAFPCPDAVPASGGEALLALEHFDDQYVRAIGYQVKAARADTPKAVLIIDVGGHDQAQAERGVARLRGLLEGRPNTLLFEARDPAEAKRFWADRKKLGAIARRTNAFKLNEDVVIPLPALAEFARFVDALNLREERLAQERFLDLARAAFREAAGTGGEDGDAGGGLATKLDAAEAGFARARAALDAAAPAGLRSLAALEAARRDLAGLAQGRPALLERFDQLHREVRDRRIVLATHMHAGDGNVHVNVPVLSNDRAMLRRADMVIDEVMAKVVALDGVVSGEHGIGVTKLKYLDPERIEELAGYRREADPGGLMNPGKLAGLDAIRHIFTPSFNLMELEARILQHGQLEELARAIAHCVRCGKCKPDCCVFHPGRRLFHHPRNKNLAIGALVEALLYDAQRGHATDFRLLRRLEELADHCTVCHKCLKPCPVDIDTGAVSVLERTILASHGYKRTPLATRLTLAYLESRSGPLNRLFRAAVLRAGGAAQGAASRLTRPLRGGPRPPASYAMQLLSSPMAPVPALGLRDLLPACAADQVLVFEPERSAAAGSAAAETTTVCYFPGCGSERMHGPVAMAAIHLLLETGTRVVLPPPYLCCGFPAHVNAKAAQHSRIVLRDTILFDQIRTMFAHLDFSACVVTCGTCMEGLAAMEADRLFGGRVLDLAAFLAERGLRLAAGGGHLYHAPCHDSLKGHAGAVAARLGLGRLEPVPHCCSEAGTLALSRPDITGAMLHRKGEALAAALGTVPEGAPRRTPILTNCPSCLQGLGRQRHLGLEPKHLAVALAERHSGAGWMERFRIQARKAEAFPF